LSFTTGERSGGASQRKVIKTYIKQESKTSMNLFHNSLGDLRFTFIKFYFFQEVRTICD
jgi:hypothetical protein